jgi:hypothetical protein
MTHTHTKTMRIDWMEKRGRKQQEKIYIKMGIKSKTKKDE